ncbi:MAG: DUF1294 domain-containing protein [Candidatus Omnitrophica bacterium]|nr:DUF1294 domain-containing protein [Candidatus Omnitrophota bacterium]
MWICIYFLVVNFAAFILMGLDKQFARKKSSQRVPEMILHLAHFFGGTPGSFIAQKAFRHKTSKPSFQVIFWLIVGLQAVLWVILWQN